MGRSLAGVQNEKKKGGKETVRGRFFGGRSQVRKHRKTKSKVKFRTNARSMAVRYAQPTGADGGSKAATTPNSHKTDPDGLDDLSWPFQAGPMAPNDWLQPRRATPVQTTRLQLLHVFCALHAPAPSPRKRAPQPVTFSHLSINHDLTTNKLLYTDPIVPPTAIMDSDTVKKAIMKQALQATNTANARTLIEVRRLHSFPFTALPVLAG